MIILQEAHVQLEREVNEQLYEKGRLKLSEKNNYHNSPLLVYCLFITSAGGEEGRKDPSRAGTQERTTPDRHVAEIWWQEERRGNQRILNPQICLLK